MLDTLTVVQTAVDSLSQTVGTQVGSQVTAWVALGLSVITTFLVGVSKKALVTLNNAPGPVKALVAVGFAQVATWVTVKTGLVVNPDVNALTTTVTGVTVALGSMGVHALNKTLSVTKRS